MDRVSFSSRGALRRMAVRAVAAVAFCGFAAASSATTGHLTLSGTPPTSATVGKVYSFKPTVSNPSGKTVKFLIVNRPSWASFSATTGLLTGTPPATAAGTTQPDIGIEATVGSGYAFLPGFAIHVGSATGTTTDKPTISGTPGTSATVGKTYTFQPTAKDPAGKTLSFSVKNKPAWASFSTATGALVGTPAAANVGTYSNIIIVASNGTYSTALPAFSIAVGQTQVATTLSAKHPGDNGIGSDPSVVWYEGFQEASVTAVVSRYDSHTNTAGMAFVADHPPYSPGTHAMQLTAGGSTPATDLYKSFGAGKDELYFRYYAKYIGAGPWHHSGLWIGGYNPPLPYPDPHAGVRPNGDDRFSIGLEPISDFPNVPMDFYAYWMGMQSFMANPTGVAGDYYGNTLLEDAEFRPDSGNWDCYEIHLKLNPNPSTGSGAILEVWRNDVLVRRFDNSGPLGYWVRDKFCPANADGTECTAYRPPNATLELLDQQWRATSALKINYFWPQNYNTDSTKSSLRLDDMVVATQRIGCTVEK